MTVKPVIRPDKRGNAVYNANGVKLFVAFGTGSKRRAYDFIAAQSGR